MLIATTLTLIITFSTNNIFAQDTIKIWSKEHPLMIDDFKGLPTEVETRFPEGVFMDIPAAYLAASISIDFSQRTNYWDVSVINEVNRNLSFMNDTATAHWLQHEQCHFDINEIFVRKIRRAIELLQKEYETNIEVYNEVIDNELQDLDSFQYRFDFETSFGVNKENQNKWARKIQYILQELEEYEN